MELIQLYLDEGINRKISQMISDIYCEEISNEEVNIKVATHYLLYGLFIDSELFDDIEEYLEGNLNNKINIRNRLLAIRNN